MGHIDFEKYARVIVRIGANVQKGQDVRVTAELDQAELVRAVVEESIRRARSTWTSRGTTAR